MARQTMAPSMAAALMLLAQLAGASFVASPMEHHLQISAGEEGSTRIVIRNTAEHPITLKLYLADSRFDNDGRERDADPGTVDRSCASWIQLEDALLDIAPGETRHTGLRLAVPDGASGSYWTKVYIEETGGPQAARANEEDRRYRVLMRQRVGIRIFQDVPGTRVLNATVTDVQVQSVEENERGFSIKVANKGNALLRCRGHLEIRDPFGDVSEVLLFGTDGEFWIFPGGLRNLSTSSRIPLSPGTYTALAVVDFGGEYLIAGEQIFQVSAEGLITGIGSEGL